MNSSVPIIPSETLNRPSINLLKLPARLRCYCTQQIAKDTFLRIPGLRAAFGVWGLGFRGLGFGGVGSSVGFYTEAQGIRTTEALGWFRQLRFI